MPREKRVPATPLPSATILLVRDGQATRLDDGGMPIGIFAGAEYGEGCHELQSDDLLVLFRDLLKNSAEARRAITGRCHHVLVDEYQDTNKVQGHIAALLATGHGDLMVVGDETSLTSQEDAKKTLLESWGFLVDLIDDAASQTSFNTAVTVNDVVFVSGEVSAGALGAKLKIPAGTESGKIFRLRGQGVVDSAHGHGKGDQHIQVKIEVPGRLSGKEKKAMQKLVDMLHDNHFEETAKMNKMADKFYERKRKLESDS